MHRANLLAELGVGDLTIRVGVHDCEHHAQVQVLRKDVLLDLLLGRLVFLLCVHRHLLIALRDSVVHAQIEMS